MARKYLAFDIETAAEVPGPEFDWRRYRPIGITCAAVLASDASEPTVWHGKQADGLPAARMSPDEARNMVHRLSEMVRGGYTLLTWNGLGFDFNVLAEEAGALELCRDLALNHVDMMFHVFCDRGFPVALDKAAAALRIPGKPPGMSGLLAPRLWADGRFQEVMDYVAQDVRIALEVARLCEERRSFQWTTRRGTQGFMPLASGWLTVREALELPEPDTSWMTQPLPRQSFTDWLRPE
ncbi:MAG TPA: ribonuclease H-like domain-containing protein [Candidatus Binatia bacterium]